MWSAPISCKAARETHAVDVPLEKYPAEDVLDALVCCLTWYQHGRGQHRLCRACEGILSTGT